MTVYSKQVHLEAWWTAQITQKAFSRICSLLDLFAKKQDHLPTEDYNRPQNRGQRSCDVQDLGQEALLDNLTYFQLLMYLLLPTFHIDLPLRKIFHQYFTKNCQQSLSFSNRHIKYPHNTECCLYITSWWINSSWWCSGAVLHHNQSFMVSGLKPTAKKPIFL